VGVYTTTTRDWGGFKELILDNLFVTTKNAAQLFDNTYRESTNLLADDLAFAFALLTSVIDGEDTATFPNPNQAACALLWQAANGLIAAYQTLRVGSPVEAAVVIRHVQELQALANVLSLEPSTFEQFMSGKLKPTMCIAPAKTLFPGFGLQYGMLSQLAHPSMKTIGTFLHQGSSGNIVLLVRVGLPDGKPRLVRNMLTAILVLLAENQSAMLHASSEFAAFANVPEPRYFARTPGGMRWAPSSEVKERWASRTTRLLELGKLRKESAEPA
jgi:hypothetical protein